jgi:GTP-binding protein
MKPLGGNVAFIGSFPDELPTIGLPEVAFAGRSNVGKSSALNCLLGSKRAARVSSTPGRTQAINLFRVHDRLVFADLPGYGFAKVPDHIQARWKPMVEGYLGSRDTLRLVVVFVDVRREPLDLDLDLVDGLRAAGIPFRVVATKADKLKRRALDKQLAVLSAAFPGGAPLPFSSHTRAGRDQVWKVIEEAVR